MTPRRPRLRRLVRSTAAVGALTMVLSALTTGQAPASAAVGSADEPAMTGDTVSSPDATLSATVGVVDGRLTYGVVRDGTTTVVAPSGLGFTLTEPAVDLTAGMSVTSVERSSKDETWTPAWGSDSRIRNQYNELVVHAVHAASGTRLDVTVRVFDDGFGLRYTFPQQDVLGAFNVTKEATRFGMPATATAYYIKSGTDWNADEKHYQTVPITSVATAQTPITMSVGSDLFMSIHEADLTDYPSMTLNKDAGVDGRLVSELMPLPGGLKAKLDVSSSAFSTPWRTVTIGRNAADLANSHLISNLNPPCAICDVDSDADGVDDTADWIQPATYTGVWWELQRRATTWFAGPNHGATTKRVKEYIDLAASAGAKFVLAEGWNVGAGNNWTGQDFLTPMSDFDLPDVLAYAKSKDVGFIAHNETRGDVDYYEKNMEKIFTRYEELGIHAIKTGYATKFLLGGVNRGHADQEAVRHYRRVMEVAARHHITVNAHEAIKPTGLDRTYPNMMTGEGVAGMEQQNYMGANGNPPEQATILPFTRWMGGPADYTPGVLNVTWDPSNTGNRVQTTTATQLALYTTFFSPLQMLADTPENYAGQATAFEYLKGMPATWDESDVLDAKIGDYIVTARRKADRWYLGAVTDENDRTIDVPLSFLESGTKYVADVFGDAADTSWKGNPTSVKRTRSIVDSTDVLTASMVGAGGQAARFTKATAADLENVPEFAPVELSVSGTPTASYDPVARTVTVTAEMTNNGTGVSFAYAYLNGTRVDTARARLDSRSSAPVSLTVPISSFPYAKTSDLAIGDGRSAPGKSVKVQLLPFPTQELIDRIGELDASGDLSHDVARKLERLVDDARALAGAGDLPGVELKMQSVRLTLLSASADQVKAAALTAIDSEAARWLGRPAGVMQVLSSIRAAEDGGVVTAALARSARESAASAARAAIRGDQAATRSGLEAVAATLESAGTSAPVVALRAVVAQVRGAKVVLEAESGTMTGGAVNNTEHAGYTGTGFVKGFTAVGACTDLSSSTLASGRYKISVRFGNGMIIVPLDRQMTLSVGPRGSTVLFANQGQDANRWKRWAETAPTVFDLTSGDRITLCYRDGDSGNINADSISLTPDPGVIVRTTATELPTIDATVDPSTPDGDDGWWLSPVEVTATPGGAAGAAAEVRIDDSDWVPAPEAVRLAEDGVHALDARAVTDDEVSASKRIDLKIDTTTPVSVARIDLQARTVSVRAADETSGVARVEARTAPDADFTTYEGPIEVGADGADLMIRAVDRAGNVEDAYDVRVPAVGVDLADTTTSAVAPTGDVPFGTTAGIGVRVSSVAGSPTGWVEVLDGDTVLSRAELADGRATVDVPRLSLGAHDLTIRYGGDAAFASSSDTVEVVVGQADSTTRLVVDDTVVAGSAPVARISVDAGTVVASGRVQVRSGSTVVAEGDLTGGAASVQLPASLVRRAGVVRLTAVYLGSAEVRQSISPVAALSVVRARPASVRVSGHRYASTSRPEVRVRVGALSNGRQPDGRVVVYVSGRKVKDARLRPGHGGTVVVRLPRALAKRSSIKVKATFVPADTTQVAGRTSPTVTIRRR